MPASHARNEPTAGSRRTAPADELLSTAVFDQHGSSLYVFAIVLTGDPELAERLVIQAIVAHAGAPTTLRELSAAVHIAWICCDSPASSHRPAPPADDSPRELMLREVCALPDDERAALGLCKYGGHSLRQTAEVLAITPEQVARLLCETLRTLAIPADRLIEPSPAA